MKKLFKLLCAAIAVATMSTVAVNAEETILLTTSEEYTYNYSADVLYADAEGAMLLDLPVAGDAVLDADCNGDITGYVESVTNLGSGEFCIKADGQVWYTFNAPTDGTYTVALLYVANPRDVPRTRGTGWAFDSTDSINTIWCEETGADIGDVKWVWFDVELTAGDHTFYLTCPEGFDDSTYKTVGFWRVAILFDAEKNVEIIDPAPSPEDYDDDTDTDADVDADTDTDTDVDVEPAPATADLAVIAIVALGAYVVAKKH